MAGTISSLWPLGRSSQFSSLLLKSTGKRKLWIYPVTEERGGTMLLPLYSTHPFRFQMNRSRDLKKKIKCKQAQDYKQ